MIDQTWFPPRVLSRVDGQGPSVSRLSHSDLDTAAHRERPAVHTQGVAHKVCAPRVDLAQ